MEHQGDEQTVPTQLTALYNNELLPAYIDSGDHVSVGIVHAVTFIEYLQDLPLFLDCGDRLR
jgi:subtilase family serine protease